MPAQTTSFVGREQEIGEIKELLRTSRLLTLTGAGGAGKTRLALRVAAEVPERFLHGVWLAELAVLSDRKVLPKAIVSALGIPEQPGRQLIETLAAYLRHRTLLLILDNCEHLLSACAQLATALLEACANLRILATSRERLGIAGELAYNVPSLSLPDPRRRHSVEHLQHSEAIRLFTERAVLCHPRFRLTDENAAAVVEVCRRLDGIPLAIELAAARVKVLAVEQIASRLDDRFRFLTGGSRTALPRQQTLRATLDWSYDLMSEQERTLLRRLSVFAGGFTFEAAEEICAGEEIDKADILDLVTHLVDKSLVIVDEQQSRPRYRMLETVRQYAGEKLQEAGEADDRRRRHRDWCLAFAEQAYPEMFRGQRNEKWLERLETEHDNLRAALQRSQAEKDGAEVGLRLAGALHWLWFQHDHWSEALRWTEAALARSGEAQAWASLRALGGATHFAWRRGDYATATTLGEKGLALCRRLKDSDVRGTLLFHLGIVAMRQGANDQAKARFDECLTVARELGNDWLYGTTLVQLGILSWYQGDNEQAAVFHTESVALLRKVGDSFALGYALHRFGRDVALEQGDYERAAASFRESLVLCRQAGNRWISAECLEGFAIVASARGRMEEAGRLLGAAQAEREILGERFSPPHQAWHDRWVTSARAALGGAAFTSTWAEGRGMPLDQAIDYALASSETSSIGATSPPVDKEMSILTRREREVAGLIARGLTNREIAKLLVVSERTAESHVQHILEKLALNSRGRIATWAIAHGLNPQPQN